MEVIRSVTLSGVRPVLASADYWYRCKCSLPTTAWLIFWTVGLLLLVVIAGIIIVFVYFPEFAGAMLIRAM